MSKHEKSKIIKTRIDLEQIKNISICIFKDWTPSRGGLNSPQRFLTNQSECSIMVKFAFCKFTEVTLIVQYGGSVVKFHQGQGGQITIVFAHVVKIIKIRPSD